MSNTMTNERLEECLTLVTSTLDGMKAKNITVLDVEDLTDVMEHMVIAEGTSKRHVRAMAWRYKNHDRFIENKQRAGTGRRSL